MAKKPIVVKEWIESGELNPKNKRMNAILEDCAGLMDGSCACDILGGGILFKATNGKYYTITIEAVVGEASPEFVKDVLTERISVKDALKSFFECEVRNEDDGGVSPATLGSAMDSWVQAPDDVLEDWCGGKTDLAGVKKALQALIKKYGTSWRLTDEDGKIADSLVKG
jgi:hypothetical protein